MDFVYETSDILHYTPNLETIFEDENTKQIKPHPKPNIYYFLKKLPKKISEGLITPTMSTKNTLILNNKQFIREEVLNEIVLFTSNINVIYSRNFYIFYTKTKYTPYEMKLLENILETRFSNIFYVKNSYCAKCFRTSSFYKNRYTITLNICFDISTRNTLLKFIKIGSIYNNIDYENKKCMEILTKNKLNYSNGILSIEIKNENFYHTKDILYAIKNYSLSFYSAYIYSHNISYLPENTIYYFKLFTENEMRLINKYTKNVMSQQFKKIHF